MTFFKLIRSAVIMLNRGQTYVFIFYQPLFTVVKSIQWNLPWMYREQNFVIIFGGLHIEMAAFKAYGSWLHDSERTSVLVNTVVTSPSTVDSFLKASHVTKSQKTHQVTANTFRQYTYSMNDYVVILESKKWC